VHYRPSHLAIYPRCARSATFRANIVTGDGEEIGLIPAEIERMSERAGHLLPANRCTEAGIYFKPKPVITRTRIVGQPEPSALSRFWSWFWDALFAPLVWSKKNARRNPPGTPPNNPPTPPAR
jgi:hypothetical protein